MRIAIPLVILLIQAIAFGILSAIVADQKNRNPGVWATLGFLFGPFGFTASLVVGEGAVNTFDPEDHEKKCPDCAERVKLEARVCKHCGHEWTDEEVKKQVTEAQKRFEESRALKRPESTGWG